MEQPFWTRQCETCGVRYEDNDPSWRCRCGGFFTLEGAVPFGGPSPDVGLWRYRASLPPAEPCQRVSLGEGSTPLARVRGLPGDVYAKLEFASPTGSFKDRGIAIVVSRLRRLGIPRVVEDSSGNAGASLAAYCAAADIRCTIYAPDTTSPGKLVQIRGYGAEVVLVPGPRPAATEAALAAAQDAYYANHAWDPFFLEGTKTAAFEIVEQLGGQVPARVVLPVGQGTLFLGLAKGFRELREARRIPELPRLVAVQSSGCAPLYEAFRDSLAELPAVSPPPRMLAEGIATARPLRWRAILDAIRDSRGAVVRVAESAIPAALARLGRAGLFVEPTAATVLAALEQLPAAGSDPDGPTVLVLTGSGLKATTIVGELLDSVSQPRGFQTGGGHA